MPPGSQLAPWGRQFRHPARVFEYHLEDLDLNKYLPPPRWARHLGAVIVCASLCNLDRTIC